MLDQSHVRKRCQTHATRLRTLQIEPLERRDLLAAAFDLIGLTALREDPVYSQISGRGVAVAVIDTGLDVTHPLIAGNYVAGRDFVFGGTNPTPVADHGTHVAGIVGSTDPNIGVAPGVDLIGLQVFTPRPGGDPGASQTDIEEALQWVLANRATYNIVAVNMSLGSGFYETQGEAATSILFDDIQRLEAAGVTVVSAAGNSYGVLVDSQTGQTIDKMFPNSGSPGILSTLNVGAVYEEDEGSRRIGFAIDFSTAADRITGFSQRPPLAPGNVIFAPGALINSTITNNRQAELAGTSMASPMVAGVVALMQQAAFEFGGRYLSPGEVREIILSTADTIFDGDDEDSSAYIDRNGDRRITQDELIPFRATNRSYLRINSLQAVREVRSRVTQGGGGGGGGTEGDPNGTIATAFLGPSLNGSPVAPLTGSIGADGSRLENGSLVGGVAVGATDVDMFRFEMQSPGTVTIETSTSIDAPLDFDSFLRLFDGSGNQLSFDNDSGLASFSRINVQLGVGTYFVGVSGFNNSNYDPNRAGSGVSGSTGNYTLTLALSNQDPNGLLSGAVAVNLASGQREAVFEGLIGEDYGQVVGVADVDLFRVVVPDNGLAFVDIDTPFVNGFVDSYLRVFDENGIELAFSDDDLSIDFNNFFNEFTDPFFPGFTFEDPFDRQFFHGHTTDSFLFGQVERGEIYYIGVSDFFNQNYNPANLNNRANPGTGGRYQLKLSLFNFDQNGSIPQAIDTSAVGLPIVNQPGIIGQDATQFVGDMDVDFVRLRPTSNGILEIDIDSWSDFSITTPVDTVLFVFNQDGQVLASNDDADGLDPLLRIDVQRDTDYYVAIVGFGNDSFDPFVLGSGLSGATGEYRFNARLLPNSQLDILSNDQIGLDGVQLISMDETILEFVGNDRGYVRGDTDVDLFRWQAPESMRLQVRTERPSAFGSDTFLRVFDTNGNELASNGDAGPSLTQSQVVLDVVAGQTYYIGVNGDGENPGSYNPLTGTGAQSGNPGAYLLSLVGVDDAVALLDVTGGGNPNPFQDGVLIVRFMLGQPIENLEDPRLFPTGATRTTGAAVDAHLRSAGSALDVNGDGTLNPFQDGILIVRHLLGQPDESLDDPRLYTPLSTRTTGAAVRAYLNTLMPQGGATGLSSDLASEAESLAPSRRRVMNVIGRVDGDVNRDGMVTARDALNVINEIRRTRSTATAGLQESYFDVNLDGRVTASDALFVINRLAEDEVDAVYRDLVNVGLPDDEEDAISLMTLTRSMDANVQ